MMRHPERWALSRGMARRAERKAPVRLTSRVRPQSTGVTASTPATGPPMPALLTRTSSPPRWATASSKRRSTSSSFDTSATVAAIGAAVTERSHEGGIDVAAKHRRSRLGEPRGDHPADAATAGGDDHAMARPVSSIAYLLSNRAQNAVEGQTSAGEGPVDAQPATPQTSASAARWSALRPEARVGSASAACSARSCSTLSRALSASVRPSASQPSYGRRLPIVG